ncbi:MAG: class I SAM-dependent methyltransferase [Lachnospiraceae bacterium]|nr:class I SAM-dependent methyltransferase [Lachnospiraceae bacterium]
MEAYTGFAEVYDMFMDNVPYEKWAKNIINILKEHGIEDGLVLELGCGTGRMTRLLSDAGYDMIGVDISEEMLLIAQENNADGKILYLNQDMREFELYGTVRAVISVCDSMNYILEKEDLTQVFKLVNNYLDPKGLFIFDVNTLYKYEELLGDSVFCENREEGSFIWENYYDSENRINEYDLTIYVKTENDLYERYEEVHYQKAYSYSELIDMIETAGMDYLDVKPVDVEDVDANDSGDDTNNIKNKECAYSKEIVKITDCYEKEENTDGNDIERKYEKMYIIASEKGK